MRRKRRTSVCSKHKSGLRKKRTVHKKKLSSLTKRKIAEAARTILRAVKR